MTCRDFAASLGAYADRELDARARAAMQAHKAGCAKCAAYYRSYVATVRRARALGKADAEAEPPLRESLVRSILSARRKS